MVGGKDRGGLQADLNQENFFLPAEVSPRYSEGKDGCNYSMTRSGAKADDSCFKAMEANGPALAVKERSCATRTKGLQALSGLTKEREAHLECTYRPLQLWQVI